MGVLFGAAGRGELVASAAYANSEGGEVTNPWEETWSAESFPIHGAERWMIAIQDDQVGLHLSAETYCIPRSIADALRKAGVR